MNFYNEMDRAGPKQRQKLLKMLPKRQNLGKLHECLIYRKLVCYQVRGLRSIAGYAFDHNDVRGWSCSLSSNAHNCHGARLKAMEVGPVRATAWNASWLGLRSIVGTGLEHIALDRSSYARTQWQGAYFSSFALFHSFCRGFIVRTCNTKRH